MHRLSREAGARRLLCRRRSLVFFAFSSAAGQPPFASLPPRPPPSNPPSLSPPPRLTTPVSPPVPDQRRIPRSVQMSPMMPSATCLARREIQAESSLLHALSDCGISFEKVRRFLVFSLRPLWWASLYSRALTTICDRRRSPGFPFPPDHRQAGERGGGYIKYSKELTAREDLFEIALTVL